MKKKLLLSLFCAFAANAQTPIIDNWTLNTDGTTASYWENSNGSPTSPSYVFHTTTDSANVTRVCYTNDSIWIKSEGMTTNMGKFLNPGAPSAQGFTFRFPRNPSEAVSKIDVPFVFTTGVLINGIPIFGYSDATSWKKSSGDNLANGDGYWNVDAWYGEGFTLDSSYGAHPQQDGMYHSHAIPKNLYTFPSTSHSPLVGFAFDGYPIYGPYGYTNATDANSGVTRMTSSYQLRNITGRTTLPDGTVLTSQYYGPPVNTQHPLGEYIEDFEYVDGSGTLDYYNGRYCVTPEYPNGTYAYFVTVDAAGDPAFPYYFGLQYYGNVDQLNLQINATISMPNNLTGCRGNVTTGISDANSSFSSFSGKLFTIYPNPTSSTFVFQLNDSKREASYKVRVYNEQGALHHETNLPAASYIIGLGENSTPGMYMVHLMDGDGNSLEAQKLIVE